MLLPQSRLHSHLFWTTLGHPTQVHQKCPFVININTYWYLVLFCTSCKVLCSEILSSSSIILSSVVLNLLLSLSSVFFISKSSKWVYFICFIFLSILIFSFYLLDYLVNINGSFNVPFYYSIICLISGYVYIDWLFSFLHMGPSFLFPSLPGNFLLKCEVSDFFKG